MDLQEFVRVVLVQIARGTLDAQATVAPLGAVVNPCLEFQDKFPRTVGRRSPQASVIEFDVAVTTAAGTSAARGITLKVVGAGSEHREERSTDSRVRFSVPMRLPMGEIPEPVPPPPPEVLG